MSLLSDAKTLYDLTLRPVRGEDLKERLESFYSSQAENYDSFRQRLLHGRESLMNELEFSSGERWLDVGAGTGANLDFFDVSVLDKYTILDLSPSLLEMARKKAGSMGLNNVEFLEEDACQHVRRGHYDGVVFSYSLTMIPNWFAAIELALESLRPEGQVAVVDFFVPKKFDPHLLPQNWWTRNFWRSWFSFDGVDLTSDHISFLRWKTEEIFFEESCSSVPYLPLGKVPYYKYIGRKKDAVSRTHHLPLK